MLTPAELLDFEATHARHTGAKEHAIRATLGLTPARYYVLLGRAARSLEGQAHDPITARRVREQRAHILPTPRSESARSLHLAYP